MIQQKPGHTDRCDLTMTIDHVVPLSKGGSNKLENLVLCCNRCNHKKNDILPSYQFIAFINKLKSINNEQQL